MFQISEQLFCEDFLLDCQLENNYLPNSYYDYPFLYIENFLTLAQAHLFADEIQESKCAHKAMVKTMLPEGVVAPTVEKKIRNTCIYSISESLEKLYQDAFFMHQHAIEQYFHMALTTATRPQLLEYQEGDFYIKHADDSNELRDKSGNTVGFTCVAPQRKLTTVLFLSTHASHTLEGERNYFEGGELVFNYLFDKEGRETILKPKAGDMFIFPSNPYFSHEVRKVLSGYRLTLVQWHNAIV